VGPLAADQIDALIIPGPDGQRPHGVVYRLQFPDGSRFQRTSLTKNYTHAVVIQDSDVPESAFHPYRWRVLSMHTTPGRAKVMADRWNKSWPRKVADGSIARPVAVPAYTRNAKSEKFLQTGEWI
jgi:hypothetical protein